MLCLVRQPNQVVLEVQLDNKAKGQECLDAVCEMMGIIEVDYLGLQYYGGHGEQLWLNLRNCITKQLPGAPPYRFNLAVKFFVPPHYLLQDPTRHVFYLNVLKDLQEGRLRVKNEQIGIKLCALAAQIEMGDISTNSTSALLLYPKWLPYSLIQPDHLPYQSPPLEARRGKRRKHNSGASSDNEFAFDSDHSPSSSFKESSICPGHLSPDGDSREKRMDHTQLSNLRCSPLTVMHNSSHFESRHQGALLHTERAQQLCKIVQEMHKKLAGIKAEKGKYLFLKEASALDDWGVEYFTAKAINNNAGNPGEEHVMIVGIGPKGVIICDQSYQPKLNISFEEIHLATHSGRNFYLTCQEKDGRASLSPLALKLDTVQAANALYRAVTEKHAFYSCETVRNAVTSQYIRDLRGTIASLFNEKTPLGKNYVFDIRRTCRQVYDETRRILYRLENETRLNNTKGTGEGQSGSNLNQTSDMDTSDLTDIDDMSVLRSALPQTESVQIMSDDITELPSSSNSGHPCGNSLCKRAKEKLGALQDSMLCRICMDMDISCVLFPCKHAICCQMCAPLCKKCPLCRQPVQSWEQVFLPFSASERK